jgi:hypothetical protein
MTLGPVFPMISQYGDIKIRQIVLTDLVVHNMCQYNKVYVLALFYPGGRK